jgi:polyhydroxyalkanoate synthase
MAAHVRDDQLCAGDAGRPHRALAFCLLRDSQLVGGKSRFILGANAHTAGVINPALKNESSYWTGATQCNDADQWLASATEMPDIWWNGWIQWLAPKTGKPVAASRRLDSNQDPVVEPAPGRYVKARAS